jgi:hypothetical protein
VQVAGARITGQLDLQSATLTRSLLLRQCVLDAPVVLRDAQVIAVGFPGCRLSGVDAMGMRCRGSVDLSGGFTCNGEVDLRYARIDGHLDCTDAAFLNRDGIALDADGLRVDQDMSCCGKFTAEGEVRLVSALIGGRLDCTGTFRNPARTALHAERITVEEDNPAGTALYAERITVEEDMLTCGGFTAEGGVLLACAHIGGKLDCEGGTFHNPCRLALDLERVEIVRKVLMRPTAFDGTLNLTFAKVGSWWDDAWWDDAKTKTRRDTTRLNGFTYTTISADPPRVGDRLGWLRRDPDGD